MLPPTHCLTLESIYMTLLIRMHLKIVLAKLKILRGELKKVGNEIEKFEGSHY
jgi:hypothetical protein